MRYFIIIFTLFSFTSELKSQTETHVVPNPSDSRVITTGVPFLLIASDARAAAMGDMGVATSVDTYSQHWNPSKYAFSESKSGFGISYTPYLSKLVNDISTLAIRQASNENKGAYNTNSMYVDVFFKMNFRRP